LRNGRKERREKRINRRKERVKEKEETWGEGKGLRKLEESNW
jgi:hypothetical protein